MFFFLFYGRHLIIALLHNTRLRCLFCINHPVFLSLFKGNRGSQTCRDPLRSESSDLYHLITTCVSPHFCVSHQHKNIPPTFSAAQKRT